MSSIALKITVISGLLAATANQALAAEVGRSNPSEPLVWGFLGLCALIVIAQIVPMLINLMKHSRSAAEQTKAVERQQL